MRPTRRIAQFTRERVRNLTPIIYSGTERITTTRLLGVIVSSSLYGYVYLGMQRFTQLRDHLKSRLAKRWKPNSQGGVMKVTVVSDQVGTFEVYGRTLRVSADTEVIVRFVESRYDYLRYLDEENKCLAIVRMHQSAYTTLAEFGIPETKPRTTMSQSEFNEWLEWEVHMDMAQFEEEIDEPDLDGD